MPAAGLPFLLLPLLLLPARPALGNEGAAAGSCQCDRYGAEPPLVKRFPDRLLAWEPCRGLVRFTFPQKRVCGLTDAPWVLRFTALKRDKRKGAARPSSSARCCQPSATSRAPSLPLSSIGPAPEMPTEAPHSQQVLAFTTPSALETERSVALARNGAVAAVSPNHVPPEDLPGRQSQAVIPVLVIILLLVAGMVGVVCWQRKALWRRRAAPVL